MPFGSSSGTGWEPDSLKLIGEITDLNEQIRNLKEVLSFYASATSVEIADDEGQKAREALKEKVEKDWT